VIIRNSEHNNQKIMNILNTLLMVLRIPSTIKEVINAKIRFVKFKRKVVLNGQRYNIMPGARVLFEYGSSYGDIEVGEYVTIYGILFSQSHGKIHMGNYTRLGVNSSIRSVENVFIGDYTAIANDVVITDNDNHPIDPIFRRKMKEDTLGGEMRAWYNSAHKEIIIGENVWVGEKSRIQKGVHIGNNSIIAAGSIVTHDIPENCIAAGIPAKVVKYIDL